MSKKSKSIKRQQKVQRKEAKRNLKRKAIRNFRNKLLGYGKEKLYLSIQHGKRTSSINQAIMYLDNIIKRWNDKISLDLLSKIDAQKVVLKSAMKSKDAEKIQNAVNEFVPLNQEVIELVKKFETPAVEKDEKDK